MNCTICKSKLQGNQKKFCSNTCKQKGHYHSFKEQPNSYHSQTKRALKRKLEFIELFGGACSICGYNRNIAALDFNHIEPQEKSFTLNARKLSNTNKKELLIELKKCNLLCANCHREHHHPEMELNNVKKILGHLS